MHAAAGCCPQTQETFHLHFPESFFSSGQFEWVWTLCQERPLPSKMHEGLGTVGVMPRALADATVFIFIATFAGEDCEVHSCTGRGRSGLWPLRGCASLSPVSIHRGMDWKFNLSWGAGDKINLVTLTLCPENLRTLSLNRTLQLLSCPILRFHISSLLEGVCVHR